jgi:hypothetical protein
MSDALRTPRGPPGAGGGPAVRPPRWSSSCWSRRRGARGRVPRWPDSSPPHHRPPSGSGSRRCSTARVRRWSPATRPAGSPRSAPPTPRSSSRRAPARRRARSRSSTASRCRPARRTRWAAANGSPSARRRHWRAGCGPPWPPRSAYDVFDVDGWLTEGVAEYVEHEGRPPTGSPTAAAVRRAVRAGALPKSIALLPLDDDAGPLEVDLFYGVAHFAVWCLADRYGRDRMFGFARRLFLTDAVYDEASRAEFGAAWSTVDRRCRAWIADVAR